MTITWRMQQMVEAIGSEPAGKQFSEETVALMVEALEEQAQIVSAAISAYTVAEKAEILLMMTTAGVALEGLFGEGSLAPYQYDFCKTALNKVVFLVSQEESSDAG